MSISDSSPRVGFSFRDKSLHVLSGTELEPATEIGSPGTLLKPAASEFEGAAWIK